MFKDTICLRFFLKFEFYRNIKKLLRNNIVRYIILKLDPKC